MDDTTKNNVLQRDKFTCQKCGFQDKKDEEIEIHHINSKVYGGSDSPDNLVVLCSICHHHAPDSREDFERYLNEKIDHRVLETFRKSNRSITKKTKQGMVLHSRDGQHITRPPMGYRLVNKQLIIEKEKVEEVRAIYDEFLNSNISLTQLAKNHSFTTSGIKKLLQNTTYLGKVKFAEIESQGNHESIISQELFDKVREKLSNL